MEGSACCECRREAFIAGVEVLGMQTACPAVPKSLFDCATCEVQPGLVEKGEELVRTSDPNHYWHCVGHTPETLLTFAQRGFGLLVLCNVLTGAEHPHRQFCVIQCHHGNAGDGTDVPVGSGNRKLDRVPFLPHKTGSDRLVHPLPVLR